MTINAFCFELINRENKSVCTCKQHQVNFERGWNENAFELVIIIQGWKWNVIINDSQVCRCWDLLVDTIRSLPKTRPNLDKLVISRFRYLSYLLPPLEQTTPPPLSHQSRIKKELGIFFEDKKVHAKTARTRPNKTPGKGVNVVILFNPGYITWSKDFYAWIIILTIPDHHVQSIVTIKSVKSVYTQL